MLKYVLFGTSKNLLFGLQGAEKRVFLTVGTQFATLFNLLRLLKEILAGGDCT